MRLLTTFPLSLLACGPVGPSLEATSTTTTAESATTDTAPVPTTTNSGPATTTTEPDATSTTAATTTLAHDFDIPVDTTCDVFTQDCPAGQKCTPWNEGGGGVWNAAKCVEVTGDGAPGEPCTAPEGGLAGIDDCAFGSICWQIDEEHHGTCIAQCTGTPDDPVCPVKSICHIAQDGILNLCIPICDPLLQDCFGDDLCIPNGDSFLCVLDASGDEGQTNDPCEFANNCDKGLVCLNTAAASSACDPQSTGCCQPFCKFPGAPCPNPDQQCLQWFDPNQGPVPPEYKDVGICAIPL